MILKLFVKQMKLHKNVCMPLDWISWFVGAEINMNVYNAAESVHLPKE